MIEPYEVRAFRESLGEPQWLFGQRFGVSQPLIAKWEREGVKNAAHEMLVVREFVTVGRKKARTERKRRKAD